MDLASRAIAVLVSGHTAVGALHGTAHFIVGVIQPVADLAYITAVIFAAPLAAVLLRLRGTQRRGDWLLLLSMIGSLAYGVGNHFILTGPDRAWGVSPGAWGGVFQATAALLAAVETLGLVLALGALRRA